MCKFIKKLYKGEGRGINFILLAFHIRCKRFNLTRKTVRWKVVRYRILHYEIYYNIL